MSRVSHETRVFLTALLAGLPGAAVALLLLWTGERCTLKTELTLTLLVLGAWLGLAASARSQVLRALQTISNLLGAAREGDYSIRGRRQDGGSRALGMVLDEINGLGETLRQQRLGELETSTLLEKVMREIDVAIFAFDQDRRLRLVNRAGELLLGRTPGRMLGESAEALGVSALLEGEAPRTLPLELPGGRGHWELRRASFRQHGRQHELLVLTDLQRALREEEREAWQRLVRVLGHEINNSLTPISSIAGGLQQLLQRQPRPPDWETDVARGLEVVGRRAEALGRFMTAYARLAKLPPPRFAPVAVEPWVRRVAELDRRLPVAVEAGPAVTVPGDADQLDQLLINLVRNAVDAALETGGGVSIGWRRDGKQVEVVVSDDGPGIAQASNLFVPFFTTKPGGSGIGLVLSRQIAEAHHGTLELRDRQDPRGCRAVLRLPV